jgi:hypothetical protein
MNKQRIILECALKVKYTVASLFYEREILCITKKINLGKSLGRRPTTRQILDTPLAITIIRKDSFSPPCIAMFKKMTIDEKRHTSQTDRLNSK